MTNKQEIKSCGQVLKAARLICGVTITSFMVLAAMCLINGGDFRYAAMAVVTYLLYDASRGAVRQGKKELSRLESKV